MSEAYGRRVVTKKVNKNVSVDIDLKNKAIRITNSLDAENEVEIKLKTLQKIVEVVHGVLDDNE